MTVRGLGSRLLFEANNDVGIRLGQVHTSPSCPGTEERIRRRRVGVNKIQKRHSRLDARDDNCRESMAVRTAGNIEHWAFGRCSHLEVVCNTEMASDW